MAEARMIVEATEEEEQRKLYEPPIPETEADLKAVVAALERMRNLSIADYYENIGIEQEKMIAIRRHVEQMRSKMTGANPPDMKYVLQFGQYDAYWKYINNGGPGVDSTLTPWNERWLTLNKLFNKSLPLYSEKGANLANLENYEDDYLNPNDIALQMKLLIRIGHMLGQVGILFKPASNTMPVFYEMKSIAEKNIEEIGIRYSNELEPLYKKYDNATTQSARNAIQKQIDEKHRQWNNAKHDYYQGVFGSAVNMAGIKYAAICDAVVKSYPTVMTNIMMISDPDVQYSLFLKLDETMTHVIVFGLEMLHGAFRVVPYIEYDYGDTQMLDPSTADREAQAADQRTNADLARQKAARDAFFEKAIDENSAWYKRENENYGAKMDFFFFKFEMNDFITKTSTILDFGCFSGTLNTVTNHLRGETAYNGTVKVGIAKDKFKNDAISAKAGATGSISFTTDGKGGIVPGSFQWKAGLEASIEVSNPNGSGGFSFSAGTGVGSSGAYAEIKGEVIKLGNKVEVGLEVTTTKGAALSGGVSITNEGNKDWNEWLDETGEALKKAGKGGDFVLDRMKKFGSKEKVLWNGEYVVHTW